MSMVLFENVTISSMSMVLFSNREFKLEINFRLSYYTSQTCGWHCTNYQHQAKTKATASGNHSHSAGSHRSLSRPKRKIVKNPLLFLHQCIFIHPQTEGTQYRSMVKPVYKIR